MAKFFLEIVMSDQFLQLSAAQLKGLLERGLIQKGSEYQLFQSVQYWIEHNVDEISGLVAISFF